MREYELAVIYDLAVTEAGGAEASVETLTSAIEARGGKILKVDHWGRRRMAYPIGRAMDGDYIISRLELDPTAVTALEAALRIDERVFRHLVVRADELPPPPPVREPRRDPEQQTGMGEPATDAGTTESGAEVAAKPEQPAAATEADAPVAEVAIEPEAAAAEAEAPVAEVAIEPDHPEAATSEAEATVADVTGETEQPATVAEAAAAGEAASAAEPVEAEPGEDAEEGDEAPPSGTNAEPEAEAEANDESRA